MEEKQQLKNNIWKLYLHQILKGALFSVPVMVLFWQDNGLNLTQIMLLQSIFAVLIVILEIPTGYFADLYGRKKSLFIGAITLILGILVYGMGSNFGHFVIAEILWGVSVSFFSGSTSAFTYDTLKNLGKENEYKKIWGKATSYMMLSFAISGIIGGFIAKIDLRYTLFLSIPFFVLLIPLIISMKEPKRNKLIIRKGYLKELLRIIKTTLVENKKLKWIIVYSGIIYAFNQSALWLYQPYFKISGLDVIYFGFIFASFHIISAISSKYTHKIEEKLGQKYSLIMMIFLVAVSYLLMSNFIFLFSFSFCFIQQFIRGFKQVIVSDYINKLVESDIRATILSVESLVSKLLYAMVVPVVGLIADLYTVQQALLVLGITSFIFGIIIVLLLRRSKVL